MQNTCNINKNPHFLCLHTKCDRKISLAKEIFNFVRKATESATKKAKTAAKTATKSKPNGLNKRRMENERVKKNKHSIRNKTNNCAKSVWLDIT